MNLETHFQVRINSIYPAHPTSFDLFVYVNQKLILYLRAGDKLTQEKISQLDQKNGVFFVKEEERLKFKEYIAQQINDPTLTPLEKAVILRESSYTLVAELYEHPDVNKALDNAKGIVNQFVEFMDQSATGISHLISLSGHDFYTYNHSLDVGIYSLGLGKLIGFKKEEILELGEGALFHDIGKRFVSPEIICKKGPLNEMEWAQMQKHPVFGLKILNDHNKTSEAIKACCFEHHENYGSGNGYPQQLKGEEIHPFARIIALTDTFDAMTTQRSYNVPKTPKQALDFMNDKIKERYDPEMLKAFYSVLGE